MLQNWQRVFELSNDVAKKLANQNHGGFTNFTLNSFWNSLTEALNSLWSDPTNVVDMQLRYYNSWWNLARTQALRFVGEEIDPLYRPKANDNRFSGAAWEQNFVFDFIKQSYLLSHDFFLAELEKVDNLSPKQRNQAIFAMRLILDSLSPSNLPLSNPQILQKTILQGGENLKQGFEKLVADLDHFQHLLAIPNTDTEAFKVGEDLAATPGQVVYRNEVMELIMYQPAQPKGHAVPLLIIPPWINRYYVLDLRPENSMVKWLLDQGLQVFLVSWRNPTAQHAEWCFRDYLEQGFLKAVDFVTKELSYPKVNLIGYCIGGTLSSMGLAYLCAHGDKRIGAATFLTTLLDFADSGDLSLFVDETNFTTMTENLDKQGYLDATELSVMFNLLRPNDLIWSHLIKQYLLGEPVKPFDLLFWAADGTRLPAKMQRYYLENMYLKNLLIVPGALNYAGTAIDLSKIDIPCFFLAAKDDHIVRWDKCWCALDIIPNCEFVLTESGHIAGVVNHPSRGKYGYYTASKTSDAESWFSEAKYNSGSWWVQWLEWVKPLSGDENYELDNPYHLVAKDYGLMDAPGSYVLAK